MRRPTSSVLYLGCLLPAALSGRPPQARESFDVADVKVNKSGSPDSTVEMLPGGRITMRNVSMTLLVTLAFDVRPKMVLQAPGWFDSDRFDVVARGRRNASEADLRGMLAVLLADRFRLAAHSGEKVLPGFVLLTAMAGARLGKADKERSDDEGCTRIPSEAVAGEHHVHCYMSMHKLAEALPVLAPGYADKPVVDQTGKAGFYRFDLEWMGAIKLAEQGGHTLFDALESLGLKLDSRKVSLPVIVVDHVERLPAGN